MYGYPSEHYPYWHQQFPDQTLAWGGFGENLTTEGLLEDALFIGDRLQVGSAVLTVTQPRLPCYKLAARFDRDDMIKRFLISRRGGFYFSVAEEGEIAAGSQIEVISRGPNQVSSRRHNQPIPQQDPEPRPAASRTPHQCPAGELEKRSPAQGRSSKWLRVCSSPGILVMSRRRYRPRIHPRGVEGSRISEAHAWSGRGRHILD